MDFLTEYKWYLLIGSEILFWALVGLFVVMRYLLGLERASLVLSVVCC